jgi:hypothetical protein
MRMSMNTTSSGSGRVDDTKDHPQGEIRGQTNLVKPEMRQELPQLPFEEKIRKVGELIRLRQRIKTDVSDESALLTSLDEAPAELDAGKGIREFQKSAEDAAS